LTSRRRGLGFVLGVRGSSARELTIIEALEYLVVGVDYIVLSSC
jgi:hypothetical protein